MAELIPAVLPAVRKAEEAEAEAHSVYEDVQDYEKVARDYMEAAANYAEAARIYAEAKRKWEGVEAMRNKRL
jgi:hypothetical protein